jgi:hypothetical protein
MPLTLLRWLLESPTDPPVRAQERIVRDALGPTWHAHLLPAAPTLEYYASKHGTHHGWLTIICDTAAVPTLRTSIVPTLGAFPRTECISATDRLLQSDCVSYRQGLCRTTDIAMDLHLSPLHVQHQRFLVHLMCAGAATPDAVRAYCFLHSSAAQALAPEADRRYWAGFYEQGPSAELSFYGHWLWNIVVGGRQPVPGDDPSAFLQALGVP